jgi:hypothetical protein
VFENHSSTHPEVHSHKAGSMKQTKELPDVGFAYVKNKNAEKVTKPDKPLDLPKGTRYNFVTGSLEKYPNFKVKQ